MDNLAALPPLADDERGSTRPDGSGVEQSEQVVAVDRLDHVVGEAGSVAAVAVMILAIATQGDHAYRGRDGGAKAVGKLVPEHRQELVLARSAA